MSAPAARRRVFLVTGSNTGVGYETARQLAVSDDRGERTILLACRTPAKAQAAVAKILAELPAEQSGTRVEWMQLDLTDYHSITQFVEAFKARHSPLHVLINNAGVNLAPEVLPQPLRVEHMMVANYLGPFLLTQLLLPVLLSSAPSRIINVSSYMHRMGSVRDLEGQLREARSTARTYSSSKLFNILHAYELHRRYSSQGVSCFVTHPGACYSDIWNTARPKILQRLKPLMSLLFNTTAQGAAPSVHAALLPVGDGHTAGAAGAASKPQHFGPYASVHPHLALLTDLWQPSCLTRVTLSDTAAVSYDEKIAAQLWTLSEKLCDEWASVAAANE